MDINKIIAKLGMELVENRIETDALKELLVKKEILNEEEFNSFYEEIREEKIEAYSAELLELSIDEYNAMTRAEDE
ncbi:hypothetical protein [Halalkalibacter alkalisediminis]|uniref:CARD domain-containing protein n=1 Tax=Halalkalibacter alkalisediminis TaxID=935616 RepID=A0ABV6NFW9_9BACI|nr:hypothetical protein [Halalkalibacter alkalisediminis]